ncbi:MAG: VOC family protein [Deltaproteobacteria bacterium]|nr:MAG: VOC family protein [Deltaproteobacteria bacterium]
MESPFKVTGIDHVVLHIKDLARAKKFYIDFLGMTIDHESSWQCFLSPSSKSKTTKRSMAAAKSITWRYAWPPAIMNVSKRRSKTPASKCTVARMICIASISTTPTAITYNF